MTLATLPESPELQAIIALFTEPSEGDRHSDKTTDATATDLPAGWSDADIEGLIENSMYLLAI